MFQLLLLFVLSIGFSACRVSESMPDSTATVPVEETSKIPTGALAVLDLPADAALFRHRDGFSRGEVVEIADMLFNRALRFETIQRPDVTYAIGIRIPMDTKIQLGDVCLVTLWVRSLESEDESGEGRIIASVEETGGRYRKTVTQDIWAGREWSQIFIPFTTRLDLPEPQISLHLGVHPQVVEIGGVSFHNFGKDMDITKLPRNQITYAGREPDAPWREEASRRIEMYRKGDFTLKLHDAEGLPIENAEVEVELVRHAFGFGAAVTGHELNRKDADGDAYRHIVETYFNRVVFENDLKWRPWENGASNSLPRMRREWVMNSLDWLAERKIEVRGHYIIWGPLKGTYLENYRDNLAGYLEEIRAHMHDKLPAVGDRVVEWDFANHPVGWGFTLSDLAGGQSGYAALMELARELAPGIRMWVNEGQILPGEGERIQPYLDFITELIEAGGTPDGIGFMGHFSATALTPPEELWRRMDRFAEVIPRLQITELDVGGNGDEQLQADYYRDVLIASFAHPAMEGVVMWGFWEGRHWFPERALWRTDWTRKPAADAWLDLVHRQWDTKESLKTSHTGEAHFRGFYGTYRVTIRTAEGAQTLEIPFTRDNPATSVRFVP